MRITRTSDDPKDPRHRLVVEDEDGGGLVTIADEDISSPAITAQTTGVRAAIDLNSDEARWLYFSLGKLLLAREMFDPHGIHGVTDAEANAQRPGLPKPAIKRLTLDERIAAMVEQVELDEDEIGVLSTGEQIAVAVVLDRRDLVPAPYNDSWQGALERLGEDWLAACRRVARRRSSSATSSPGGSAA